MNPFIFFKIFYIIIIENKKGMVIDMEYYVANSYKDAEWLGEPFENAKGKMVVKVRMTCPRCGGSGSYSYNSFDGTRCYGCGGSGHVVNTVRAYTEKEKAAMDRAATRRAEQKEQARQEKIQKNIDEKPALVQAFYKKNGFNENGETYIVLGNSYDIKDELKEKGFKYDPVMKWHGPEAFSYKTVKANFDDIFSWNDKYGVGNWKESSYDFLNNLIKSAENSEADGKYFGEVKERLRNLELSLVERYKSENAYGISECLTFKDADDNYFSWWTSTFPQGDIGQTFHVTGTVKAHNAYKGKKITVLTRCKLEAI